MTPPLINLNLPSEHPCYKDHFPGDPVVPGALLLQWVLTAIRHQYPAASVLEIRSAKFLAITQPGDQCQLRLAEGAHSGRISFECQRGGSVVLKGALELEYE